MSQITQRPVNRGKKCLCELGGSSRVEQSKRDVSEGVSRGDVVNATTKKKKKSDTQVRRNRVVESMKKVNKTDDRKKS